MAPLQSNDPACKTCIVIVGRCATGTNLWNCPSHWFESVLETFWVSCRIISIDSNSDSTVISAAGRVSFSLAWQRWYRYSNRILVWTLFVVAPGPQNESTLLRIAFHHQSWPLCCRPGSSTVQYLPSLDQKHVQLTRWSSVVLIFHMMIHWFPHKGPIQNSGSPMVPQKYHTPPKKW